MTTSSTTCAADWRSTDRRQSALAVVLRSRTGHLKPAWGTGGSGSQGLCPRSFGKALFFGLQDPSASGVRHREGGSGSRASASAHGEISGWKLTCIHETQVLPAEDLVRPPVYELPGRKAAPFCEPPRAPRAFPTDHVSQKQFSGERGCAALTPTARDKIISTRRREDVILDKLLPRVIPLRERPPPTPFLMGQSREDGHLLLDRSQSPVLVDVHDAAVETEPKFRTYFRGPENI